MEEVAIADSGFVPGKNFEGEAGIGGAELTVS
jgi:hypothetical protein